MVRIFSSSSAADRLNAAIQFLSDFSPGDELALVGATRDSVDDLVREFARAARATFGLHRFSFTQFAATIALPSLAKEGLAPGSSLGFEAVAARAVFEVSSRRQMAYFSPVSSHPGFARACAKTLEELRLSLTECEDLKRLPDPGPDNAALLMEFDKQLASAAVADRALLFSTATQCIREGAPLAKFPVLVLDVPIHSRVEEQFLLALAGSSPEMLILVPTGDHRTSDAVSRVSHGQKLDIAQTITGSSLARLQRYLFSEEIPPSGEPDTGVILFSAPGEERECIEIARQILEQARQGVLFDQIAVLLRSPENYTRLLETAFRRAGVPAFFARGNRRPDPAGRAFLALLACAAEGLSAKRFAEYLSFSQIPAPESVSDQTQDEVVHFPEDEALGIAASIPRPERQVAEDELLQDGEERPELLGTLRTPWRWEHLLVEAAVIGGKERWSRRLSGLNHQFQLTLQACEREDPDSPRAHSVRRDLQNLAHLRSFAEPVIEQLAALPSVGNWGQWLSALGNLAPRVLRRPERVLTLLADLRPMAPVGPVSLQEVRSILQKRLLMLEEEQPAYRYGRVFVGSPDQARGRSFRVVFVPGLAEKIVPQKLREDPLLLDDIRRQLSLELSTISVRSQQERLLLQIAAGSAQDRLYVSYPRIEAAEGRPRVPSFYALDVVRSITSRVPNYEEFAREAENVAQSRLSWPAPQNPEKAVDEGEYDLSVLLPLLSGGRDTTKGRLAYVMQLNEHLARSLRSRWARWHTGWSGYDGLLSKRVADISNAYSLKSRSYSASALQRFSICPYQFALSAIYHLEARQEPEPIQQLSPVNRGQIFHAIQSDFLRKLHLSGDLPLTNSNLESALDRLDQTITDVASGYYDELAPAIDRVWNDAVAEMRADLRGWLQKVASAPTDWQPINFEFGFGFARDEGTDPNSIREPAIIAGGYRLHGFVDLIEKSSKEDCLRITDHKTGAIRTDAELIIGGGEVLQPVLYGLAVEVALKQAVGEGRLYYCTSAARFTEHTVPLNEIARAHGMNVLENIDSCISTISLIPAPKENACSFCDFRSVCGPYEEIRIASKKDRSRLAAVTSLRARP